MHIETPTNTDVLSNNLIEKSENDGIDFDYICKYNIGEHDTPTELELYQNDLLCIFKEPQYSDLIIHKMDIIYKQIKTNEFMKQIFLKSASQFGVPDISFGFKLLFAIDTLYFFYPCICELIKTNQIVLETQQYFLNKYDDHINNK
jgi:hypothetical protein